MAITVDIPAREGEGIQDIEDATAAGIAAVEAQEALSVASVAAAPATAIEAAEDAILTPVTGTLAVAEAAAIAAVIAEGDTQDARVIAEGDTQVARVIAEGDTQDARIIAEGDTQDARVIAEGVTQVSNVAAAATARILYSSTTKAQSNGVSLVTVTAGGSGGTNGVHTWTTTGGSGSGAYGTLTIAGGAVVAGSVVVEFRGDSYATAPTIVPNASVGSLTGQTLTASLSQNQPPGSIYSVVDTTGVTYYQNVAGTPTVIGSQNNLRSWRNEQRLNNAWWTRAAAMPLAAVDLGYGAGISYVPSSTNVASVLELSGNGASLLPTTGLGAVGTLGGLDALTFDGGTATKCYSGANTALTALFAASPYKTFSLHHVVSMPAITNQTVLAITKSGSALNPGMWTTHVTANTHNAVVTSTAGGTDSISSGAVRAYSGGDIVLQSQFVDGPTGKVTTFLSGEINNMAAATAIAGHTLPIGFNLFSIGGQPATTGGLNGTFAGAALFADSAHTLAEAADVHRGMVERWAPSLLQDVFAVSGLGQSNTDAPYVNASPVTFADGTAYGWKPSTPSKLDKTGIGHAYLAANSCSPVMWFAKELATILTGYTPVIWNSGSGGVGLAGGGLNGTASYLEPETEKALLAGATVSGYKANLTTRQQFRDLMDYTPRFRSELFRAMLWVGCETDVANLATQKVAGVVPAATLTAGTAEIARALGNLFDRFKADLGYTHFCLVLTGRRGATLADVQQNEPIVNAVNDAYRQIEAARDDVYIVYDHNTNYSVGSFALDDLVVAGDGSWVSGHGSVDGTHYTPATYKAIGITGARNFLRQLGLY